jgi:hypothetical protein
MFSIRVKAGVSSGLCPRILRKALSPLNLVHTQYGASMQAALEKLDAATRAEADGL